MTAPHQNSGAYALWRAYRLRWKRRYLLARAIRRRRALEIVNAPPQHLAPNAILGFACVRNEAERIAHFLSYHRELGVDHFFIVDNDSTDGTRAFLEEQTDVSLWRTGESYKSARFGMDWLTWLQFQRGRGHWCLTLDADELLLLPHHGPRQLQKLTGWLDRMGARAMSATMLDLYPKTPIGQTEFSPGQSPLDTLHWFDPHGITSQTRPELGGQLKRGGARGRMFFADAPERAPTLSKLPLVKWHWRYAYLTSTHVILPARLNDAERIGDQLLPQAAILHTKLLPTIIQKSTEEKSRRQHFSNSSQYDAYYDSLSDNPTFWTEDSVKFRDWVQLEELGHLTRGDWDGR